MDDPEVRQRVEQARDFAFQLLKGIKQIGMYRHAESKYPEFLAKAYQSLSTYTEANGPLSLKVEQQNFSLHGQDLFSEASALPYKFYRDGIRQLIFRPELSVEELTAFTLIALSEPERGSDDTLAQLWKSGLEHLEYIVVEGFKMEEFSEEQVQVEVDKIVNYLHGRLRTNSEDYLRFARVSTEDLDHKLEGIEQIRGAVVTGTTADPALKARIQKEIEEEEQQRLFPKLVTAVFQVVEGGVDDPRLLEDMFSQLLDAMLIQEDFGTINQVLLKLKAIEQRGMASVTPLREALVTKLGEEQRLGRLGEILRTSRPKNPLDITRYVAGLDPHCIPILLGVLESIELPENRALLCEALVPFARELPDPFVNRLASDRPQTIRDMVFVLERTKHPDRIRLFGSVLKSPNLAIRLEVLAIIARGRTGEARRIVAEALDDPHSQMRVQAARVLCEFDRDAAFADLMRVVRDPSFGKRSMDERGAFYASIGATGLPTAITHFHELLETKETLFHRQKVVEDKLLAVLGLQGACSVPAFKLLQEVAQDSHQPSEVTGAARKALFAVKRTLFGEKDSHV